MCIRLILTHATRHIFIRIIMITIIIIIIISGKCCIGVVWQIGMRYITLVYKRPIRTRVNQCRLPVHLPRDRS